MMPTNLTNQPKTQGAVIQADVDILTLGSGLNITDGVISASGAGLSDGDKGDITVSSSGSVWTIDTGAVSTTKLGGDITTAGKNLLDDIDAAAQRTTLGLGTAATSNSSSFATASHTHSASDITSGTKTSSFISDFNSAASAAAPVQSVNSQTGVVTLTTAHISEGSNLYYTDERVDDRVSALIQNGTGITWSYNDISNTLTPSISITQYTDEMAQDAVAAALSSEFTYNDVSNSISINSIANTKISGLGTLSTQSGTFSGTSSGTNTGDQNLFSTIVVSGQSNIVADSTSDTLTFVAGTNITLTTDSSTDTLTISASGGGGGGGLTQAQTLSLASLRI
ncbi:MAG: hypothetical protein C0446_08380 [Chitinophaga sp.]|nr:hypothetical protein [Chitinophaga sp.]